MKTRAPNKNFNNDLVYGALKLCCVHGGKDHKTSSTGVSTNIITKLTKNCLSTCQNRHLSSKERQDVENMLKVKANKKMLQNYVMQKTGKNVILKDLHNIQSNIKKKD